MTTATAIKHTIVIIDSAIDDHQILAQGIKPTAKVITLNKHLDGIAQITAHCKNHPAASIQIIAHGSPGNLQLGNSQLNLDTLHTHRQQLQQWQAAEILIYGCEVAAGESGKTFIEQLHQLTKANIAASAQKIGNAQQGGTWELEVKLGQIASTLALQPEIRQAYPGVFATFATATNFTVGSGPRSVTVGDFNGDGKLDLAAANYGSGTVSVLLGNGTGGFATATNFTVGSGPYSVTVGDFNGDGKLDLAAANYSSGTVSVLLGNGTGGFATATNFTVGSNPQSVTVGDFNGDGKLDLAAANYNSGTVSVLLGNGTGGFATATNFTVGSGPRSVTVGDFNSDGKLDLAAANLGSGTVSVLLGNGTGGFATATNFTVGSNPISVTVGDFNGDGKLDLAAANNGSGTVSVLLGNGTGGFATATNFTVGSGPRSVTVGDFNSDGKLDLAAANYNSGTVSVLLGNGTGGFATATNFTVGSGPISVTVGDFNSDGKLDLAAANYSGTVSVLVNTTPKITIASGTNPIEGGTVGSFTITLDTPAPVGGLVVNFNTTGTATATTDYTLAAGTNITTVTANTFAIAAGQTTATLTVTAVADGVSDPNETVTVNLQSSPDYILGASSTANFAPATNFTVGSYPRSVTVGDFNSDGKLDLAAANYNSGTVSVLLGNGTGGFATATNFTVGSNPQSVTVGDFNGDGKLDLAAANYTSGTVSVLLGNGTGGFATATNFAVGSNPQSVTVGDFNGDGKLDLAAANYTSGTVSVLLGNGTGGFATATNFAVGSRPVSVTVGDFNGDGKLDLAAANYTSGTVSVLLGNGTGGFATATNFTVGSRPVSVTVGDFNGDGKLDLAAANNGSSTVSVLLGNGTGGFATATNFTVGSNPRSVTVGDFNSDGKLDLAAANLGSGTVSVLLGNGTGGFATATNFTVGSGPISVTVGDFNSDGKLDLAAANYSGNNVSVLLNANPSATLTIAEPVAPVTTPTTGALTYTEKDPAKVIDAGITVTDADSTNLNSATVSITSGFAATEDTLAFTTQNGITGSYTNGVLTLTGTATVAQYQTALQSVTYQNSSDNPSTTPRTISFVVNDGTANSTPVTRNINLTAVNDAPVTTPTATALAYTEKDPAKVIDAGITVTDVDSTNLNSATVSITSGFAATEDTLVFTTQNGITGSYTNGVLTLTGTATVAQYQTALQSVTYQNSSDNPSTTPRTISFVVNDGTANSTPVTRNINLTAVNDAPVITATATALAYTEKDPAKVIDAGITVTDVDSTNLNSATVSITSGFAATEDTLAFTTQNGITGSYTNGVLTLTGTATVAQYQTALQSVTYRNSSNNPSTTPRTISFVVNDGTANSTTVTRNINLTAVNDAPVITATATALAYTEKDPAKVIDAGITVTDVDSTNLNSATVSITSGFAATEDTLAFTTQNGITGSYTNGVLTLTGTATVAQYQTALQSVTYRNSSNNPSTTPRTISFVVNDGTANSTTVTRNINLTAVNDAPVITATATALAYTKKDPAKIIDSGITVTDVDSTNLSSATVSITSGFAATEDTLAFTTQNGITGSYTNGVLTLTGTATVAQYQTALQSVTYQNSSDNPSTTKRTISFVVNDGSLNSTAKTRDINITAVNDPPTDLALSANTVNDEAPANTAIGTFSSTDPDQNDNFAYSLVSGIDDTDNNAFTIDGNTLIINNSPDFQTKSSYKIRVRTTDDGNLTFEKGLTINVNNGVEIPSGLTNPNDDIFNITGQDVKVTLEIKLTGHSSKLVNELGLFTVDDAKGTINGIAPGAEGYAKAAIDRSEVILSAIANTPNGFDTNNFSRLLQLNSGQNFRFLLVQDGTLNAVRNDPNSIGKLLFSSVSTQKITDLGDNSFSLGWKDASGKSATDFNDLVVKINQTNQVLPLGTNLQGQFQGEVIDLRDVKQSVKAEFNVYREASYNDYVGFYQVTDANGGIDTNGDGKADVLTGQAGYIQAAVRGKIAGIDLSVSNQGSATYNGVFQPGAIFAPFIIVNGTPDALLDNNSNNDPAVYFPFLGANSDKTDHIRLLASNTFGFEDLPSGGDKDFNDVIIKVNLATTI